MNVKAKKLDTKNLVLTGLFVSLGLLLPFFTSHAVGIPGNIFLPMHIPVLLCGLFCGPVYGAVCGVVVPVLSSLLTGMPPVYPMLPVMVCELLTYGAVGGFLYRRVRLPIFAALPLAMLAGRLVYGVVFTLVATAGGMPVTLVMILQSFATGIPGAVVQLILIPVLVKAVEAQQKRRGAQVAEAPDAELAVAARRLKEGSASCVVMRNGKALYEADGRGVSPLVNLYESEPEKLAGAAVADKIIGKAAAMILVCGKAKKVYGEVMSAAGKAYLEKNGILCEYSLCVDMINNRQGNGICPIEKSVLEVDDAQLGYKMLQNTLAKMRRPG